MIRLGFVHLGVAILAALVFGVDDARLGNLAAVLVAARPHRNAAGLQLQLRTFTALVFLSVVLLHGLLDHGLVLRHVSLAALFHHGGRHSCRHCATHRLGHHRLAACSHRRTARSSNRRIDSRTAYQRRSTGQRTHDTTIHLAHRLVAVVSLGRSLGIHMAALLELEDYGRLRSHHLHHRFELTHVRLL